MVNVGRHCRLPVLQSESLAKLNKINSQGEEDKCS